MLRFLISERFPGETLVTASLKAPGIVVLKLVADIDPATPVVFCGRGFQFPESDVYRARIVELLGLKNVSQISAVYHMPPPPQLTHRVEVEGRLIRIDPLNRWTKDDVRAFMREHKLPFHPGAVRRKPEPPSEEQPTLPSYNY